MTGHPTFSQSPANRPTLMLLSVLWLTLLSLAPKSADSQQWDNFPPLKPGSWLGLAPSVDPYPFRTTSSCLGSGTSRVGATYAAAVVQVSDAQGRASSSYSNAVPYVDALYQDWRRTRRLNSEAHVLMVVSLKNRGIAIHPGTRWADLGFEGRTITKVIDSSDFGNLARSGEMGRALCALAQEVDRWLANRLERQQRQTESLANELAELGALRSTLSNELLELHPELPELSQELAAQLVGLEDDLSAGRRSLDRQRLSHAQSTIRESRQGLTSIRTDMETARKSQKALKQYRPRLADLEKKLAATPGADADAFDRARRQLLECGKLLDTVEVELLSGRAASSQGIVGCLEAYESARQDAVDLLHFQRVVVPTILRIGALLLLVAILLFQLYRIRRARSRLRDLMEVWRRRLDHTADRLLDLETRHPLYFQPDFQRWEGASHEMDRDCADAVNRVYMLYSEANLLYERASEALESLKFSRLRDLDAGTRCLQETEIQLGADGSATDSAKLRLPGAEPAVFSCRADELLDEIDLTYDDLHTRLEEITLIAERFWELVGEADVLSGEASQACARRAELDSPIDALSRRLEPILDRKQDALALTNDPVTANPKLEEVLEELTAIRDRARSGNHTLEELRGPVAELGHTLRARVQGLRGRGFSLVEPGFAPDLRLDRGVHQAQTIEITLAEGGEPEAADQLAALKRSLEELGQQLDTIQHTRESLPDAVQAMEADAELLRGRIPQGREILALLEKEHDPAAFTVESDNLEELDGILSSFDHWGRQIREDYQAQRYLAAAEDLGTGETLVIQGNRLLDGLQSIEESLSETRRRAEEQASSCKGAVSKMESLAGRPGVGPELRSRSRETALATESALKAIGVERPHWPRIEQSLDHHMAMLTSTIQQIENELAAYEESRRLLSSLGGRLTTFRAEVEREQRDRPFVAQAVTQVEAVFNQWRAEVEQAGTSEPAQGGVEVLAQGREVLGKLEWAEDLWRSEMDLVRLAESKLVAAQDRFDREHGRNYGYGVVASCDRAQQLLEDCRRLRRHRQWEQVLELSGRVTEEVAAEAQRSRRLASEREEEERRRREAQRRAEERERRRRQQEAAAAAARAATKVVSSWSGSRTSSSSFGSRSGGFRSSSGGSSFGGGSRSGGSSW